MGTRGETTRGGPDGQRSARLDLTRSQAHPEDPHHVNRGPNRMSPAVEPIQAFDGRGEGREEPEDHYTVRLMVTQVCQAGARRGILNP